MSYQLTRQKYLLDEEQSHLNTVLSKFEDKDFRNTTLIWTALHTGARAQEVLNILKSDLDLKNESVLIRGIKNSDDREIPLHPWLFKRLTKLAQSTLPTEPRVFPISYIRFHQIWQNYRPVKKNLHSLRHTFAINLYRKTLNIVVVQTALGHKSLSNTMIYARYQYRNDELRRAILG